jgi:hypothetical protein
VVATSMSLVRTCDSCKRAIPGTNWWSIRLRDAKTSGSSTKYDLCDECKRKVAELLKIGKVKKSATELSDAVAIEAANAEVVAKT